MLVEELVAPRERVIARGQRWHQRNGALMHKSRPSKCWRSDAIPRRFQHRPTERMKHVGAAGSADSWATAAPTRVVSSTRSSGNCLSQGRDLLPIDKNATNVNSFSEPARTTTRTATACSALGYIYAPRGAERPAWTSTSARTSAPSARGPLN